LLSGGALIIPDRDDLFNLNSLEQQHYYSKGMVLHVAYIYISSAFLSILVFFIAKKYFISLSISLAISTLLQEILVFMIFMFLNKYRKLKTILIK
jgi:hypothetical protein